ncbi:response regulator [Pseudoalteromonas sp. JBTF-M23]|uniref:Response regulator n=1 Tax=Pseudoalteromonas caenipelagi TaxID=2726988 RepID=A0A849VJI9_9GAMM|nr:response regulator [Pseudoalteromonas caenipelagi]NOU52623.1 response regulator [Pseudoalteromonas caenipelagi]
MFLQSAFCFLLHEQHAPELPKTRQEVSGCLCLVVDDNEVNQDITANMLRTMKVNVVVLSSAANLVDIVAVLQPDIILMDIHMPGTDGFQATQALRQSLPKFTSPIVALTANAQVTERKRAKAVGMDGYLTMPVSQTMLHQALQQYIASEATFFDGELALQQMMGDAELLNKMLDKFSKMCTEYLQKVSMQSDTDKLQMMAHNIKGAAGGVGFIALSDAAMQLEQHLKETNQLQKSHLVAHLIMRLTQVREYILRQYKGD